ncbi:MAG: DUF4293 domain-containing protein [Bacteroidota bacterium]|nr:DUF4293 domain-containing protein [Bacteroidota bacterium]
MIQRIQTLYLLGAVIVGIVMFFIPLGHLIPEKNLVVDFFHNGVVNDELLENTYKTLPLTTLLGISTGLSVLIIFLYKHRVLQMRLCGVNIFLNIGLIGLIVFYMFDAAKKLNAEKDFNVAIILPVVSIIFLYLAIRNIGKDEARVKAADRIR